MKAMLEKMGATLGEKVLDPRKKIRCCNTLFTRVARTSGSIGLGAAGDKGRNGDSEND